MIADRVVRPARRRLALVLAAALLASVTLAVVLRAPNGAEAAPSTGYSVVILSADGMGAAQRTATQLNRYGYNVTQPMDDLPYGGNIRTPSTGPITDSAAAATAMGTGVKTQNNHAGVTPEGDRLPNLVEEAHSLGKSAGLVEDHDVTNATMAGYGAHVADRDHKRQIARQYLEQTKPEVMFGGGEKIWYPTGNPGKIPDVLDDDASNNKVNLVEQAKADGYQYAWDKETVDALTGPKALALVQDDAYLRGRELEGYDKGKDPYFVPEPYLVKRALEILGQDPEGFFLAIDVDGLDSAAHEHDGKAAIRMGAVVNKVVSVIQAYRETNPNVLVVVTADHETGGMMVEGPAALSTNSGPDGEIPAYGAPQNIPLPGGETPKLSGPFPVKGDPGQSFKVDWTTPGHTGSMVPITADGPGAERLSGVNDNTYVHEVASDVLNGNP